MTPTSALRSDLRHAIIALAPQQTDALSELLRGLDVLLEATRREANSIAAAYILDRADQYRNDACCKVALENLLTPIATGEHFEAFLHGELDDLMARVKR